MALPIAFPEQNWQLARPADMTDDECCALPCFVDNSQVVSCWEFSQEERDEIARTGKLYVGVRGAGVPPMWFTSLNPFTYPEVPNEVLGTSTAP